MALFVCLIDCLIVAFDICPQTKVRCLTFCEIITILSLASTETK